MISWIAEHYIEIIGALTGLIYLYLEIKQRIWLWPLGIATSAFYIYIFFVSKFYADMGLQVYYLLVSVYGWYHWYRGGDTSRGQLPVVRLSVGLAAVLGGITLALFAFIYYILVRYTDSPVPLGDAFTTALSITATWMLARKIIEHWWLWVVVNAVSLALYLYKGLYPTSVLFLFYTLMSFVGFYQWKRRQTIQEADK